MAKGGGRGFRPDYERGDPSAWVARRRDLASAREQYDVAAAALTESIDSALGSGLSLREVAAILHTNYERVRRIRDRRTWLDVLA